jgi:hypothetical protein
MDKLENLQGQVNELREEIAKLDRAVGMVQGQVINIVDSLVGRETKQLLRDADDALRMTEESLAEMTSWDWDDDQEYCIPIPNSIRKAQEYDGKTWAGLAALIRTRQAERLQHNSLGTA